MPKKFACDTARKPRTRRRVIQAASSALMVACTQGFGRTQADVARQLEEVRTLIGGRLGVHAIDTNTRRRLGFDDNSRYALASTFKLNLAAHVLALVDARSVSLDRLIPLQQEDFVHYSPVTEKYAEKGRISVEQLCEAAVSHSDNTAANLMLTLVGGPQTHTAFLRSTGDEVTRLDRIEPALNSNLDGDKQDTSTPKAMVDTMERLLLTDTLSATSRQRLQNWMINSKTGLRRIRAGVPDSWQVGDKTGTGMRGAANNLAIIWPPQRPPLLLAIYMSGSTLPIGSLNKAHAAIARILIEAYLGKDVYA